jgi:hypothetical protein
MSDDRLRRYIEEFRAWLTERGLPSLRAEQGSLAKGWGEDLAAAERLLERQPELPIAFLGPSQQGKSSLINALLGENILAVGGAVGACTCVITSVHHRPARRYRAEIEFITLADWRRELEELKDALGAVPEEEDTDTDREEWEADQEAAREKLRVVYRQEPEVVIERALRDRQLGLPPEVAAAMSTGKPIVLEEDKALPLRNKVRRYLVGREQHEDGQFWPLISRVRIFGNFDVLSNGVVLVDLPGLNDPNPARERVTRKYLQDAHHIWLVCNSQTGIDRVISQLLRDNGLLFRLYLDGRLDAFSVVATRMDDINIETVLDQMGKDPEEHDGDPRGPLEFKREQIRQHVRDRLVSIATDIATKAGETERREAFLQRVREIPVFSISTNAFLHAKGKMPHYHGLKLSADDSHVPHLIDHLHSITLEDSYKTQLEASRRRLWMLYDYVRRFFSDLLRRIDVDTADSQREWGTFSKVAGAAIEDGERQLSGIRSRAESTLGGRVQSFEERLAELDSRAGGALSAVFTSWEAVNWRSLQAAVRRGGYWYSRSLQREFDFNRDVARAYLDLVPFVWDDFFGKHLSQLIDDVVDETESELAKTAARVNGALEMLHQTPPGLRDSINSGLLAAAEGFKLQAAQVRAELTAQIQRTRQVLSNGMVETAAGFMQKAYEEAAQVPGGTGIKRRMLDALIRHARKEAPSLFVGMRRDLGEGVSVLQGGMTPQLSRIVAHGEAVLDRMRQNLGAHEVVRPEQRGALEAALSALPRLEVA